MRWAQTVRVMAPVSTIAVAWLCVSLAQAQQQQANDQQTDKVVQLEALVVAQQMQILALEERLARLEEASRILGFDRQVAAAKQSSQKSAVQPSGKPVPASMVLEAGHLVLVQWKDSWWNGEVLEALADGNVKIHYIGWDEKYDETVPRSRLQLPFANTQPAQHPAPLDMDQAEAEVLSRYAAAHPEIQAYILWTARSFGRNGLWLNEDAFANLTEPQFNLMVEDLAALLVEGEYGRHLCSGLARASALKDERLVPGLMNVAGYHRDDSDYDCRPKWMAVAALARQESAATVPLLISLVDHGNQNTRKWARAALARQTGQDLGEDKVAWAAWWQSQGHAAIDETLLGAVATRQYRELTLA